MARMKAVSRWGAQEIVPGKRWRADEIAMFWKVVSTSMAPAVPTARKLNSTPPGQLSGNNQESR